MGLRAESAGLVRLARRDLRSVWRLVESGAPADEVLHDVLPALVAEYGQMGSAVAADWYDLQRDRSGARRRFTAVPLAASDRGAHALVGFAITTARNDESLHTLIEGGVQRRITDHMRLTVANSSVYDPGAQGWERVAVSECNWCAQYITGEIHMTEGYDFDAHDWCQCEVEPRFL